MNKMNMQSTGPSTTWYKPLNKHSDSRVTDEKKMRHTKVFRPKTSKSGIWLCVLLATGLLGSGLLGCESAPSVGVEVAPRAELAIINATLIDAVGGERRGQTVLVANGKIVAVHDAGIPFESLATLDGTGKFLIPGLWDMHVHITYEPELTELMPELFLSYGITSVRDTGGLLDNLLPEVRRWRAAKATAPRIFFSGPLLDGTRVVYNGQAVPEIGIANPTPEVAIANIALLKSAGVDFVKTYELVTPDVFKALTSAARDAGLPIASHVPLMMSATDAGPMVDSMEHLRNVELACAGNAQELLEARVTSLNAPTSEPGISLRRGIHTEQRPIAINNYDQISCNEVIQALRKTIQVPTLRLNTSALYQPYDRPDWQEAVSHLPEDAEQRWLSTGKQWSERRPSLETQTGEFSLSLVRQMHRAGVPIGAGTDTPIGSALPGYSLHTELERLVEAGLRPIEALAAATLVPARFVRKEQEMGEIKTGFVADLVLLDKNPMTDITNSRSINTVISKGKIVHSN